MAEEHKEEALAVVGDKKRATALEQLASKLRVSKDVLQNTLQKTVFKECKTPEDFVSAVIIANKYDLNPILKEIYAFPAKGGGIIPIVSIDGWISLVNRNKKYDGVKLIENFDEKGELVSVTAQFRLKDVTDPVVITEYMSECKDINKTPWQKWPKRMLRHKAYIQGARVAFGFSGIYDLDEAERINEGIELEQSHLKPEVEMPQEKAQEALPPAAEEGVK